jgi:hypothetical protein
MSEVAISGTDFDQTHAEYLANKKINDEARRQTVVENYDNIRESVVFTGTVNILTPDGQRAVVALDSLRQSLAGLRDALGKVPVFDGGIVKDSHIQDIQITQARAAVEDASTDAELERAQAALEMLLMQRTDGND